VNSSPRNSGDGPLRNEEPLFYLDASYCNEGITTFFTFVKAPLGACIDRLRKSKPVVEPLDVRSDITTVAAKAKNATSNEIFKNLQFTRQNLSTERNFNEKQGVTQWQEGFEYYKYTLLREMEEKMAKEAELRHARLEAAAAVRLDKLKEKLVRLEAQQIRERKYLSLSSEARNIGYTLDTLDSVRIRN